jgi:rod shape determining protein RodA
MLNKLGGTKNLDWPMLSIYLSVVILGWLMIYSVTETEMQKIGFLQSSAGKQMIWAGISFFVLLLIYSIDWKFWQIFAYPVYAATLLFLAGVLVFGSTIKGATSWYSFGGATIQPSEFAKFGTALALSAYLGQFKTSLKKVTHQVITFGFIALPAGLILLQPDMGSTLVFSSFLVAMYREGLSPVYYWIAGFLGAMLLLGLLFEPFDIAMVLVLAALGILAFQQPQHRRWWRRGWAVVTTVAIYLYFWVSLPQVLYLFGTLLGIWAFYIFSRRGPRQVAPLVLAVLVGIVLSSAANYGFNDLLKPHQQDRINVWLNPSQCDPQGSLYNLLQSKMAISSGGLEGKGFLQGQMTKLNYVPEQSTDFIFCTIGEEHGFIGSFMTIGLFLFLLLRLTIIAERQRSAFSRIYAYCLAGIFFVHFFINIGMTMGLVPIIGIPLPFVSKGGSALLSFSIMIGVLLKLDKHRYDL